MGAQRGEGVVHVDGAGGDEPGVDAGDVAVEALGELLDQADAVAEAGAGRLVALLGDAAVLDDEEVVVEDGLDALELAGGAVDGGGEAGAELGEGGAQVGLEGLAQPATQGDLGAQRDGGRGDARVLGEEVEAELLGLAGDGGVDLVGEGAEGGAVAEGGTGGAQGAAGAVQGGADVLLEGGLPAAGLGALGLGGGGGDAAARATGVGAEEGEVEGGVLVVAAGEEGGDGLGEQAGGGAGRGLKGRGGLGRRPGDLGRGLEGGGDLLQLQGTGAAQARLDEPVDALLEGSEPLGQAEGLWVEDHGRQDNRGARGGGTEDAGGPGPRAKAPGAPNRGVGRSTFRSEVWRRR